MKRAVIRTLSCQNASSTTTTTAKVYADYLPFHNEHSAVGTTYDMIMDKANTPSCTAIPKEAIQRNLIWENSSANPDVSTIEERYECKSFEKQSPSFGYTQVKSPPRKEGLFKSMKKQSFKHLP
ncbi:unnamed protein product [Cunninghamella echinulata]